MTDELIIVRLDTGDDVVGKLISHDKDELELDEALVIRHVYDEANYPSVYLIKYMVYDKTYSVRFKTDSIVSIFYEPIEALVNYHKKTIQKLKKMKIESGSEIDKEMMEAILERITAKTLQ
jgi:methionine aminopeptidase